MNETAVVKLQAIFRGVAYRKNEQMQINIIMNEIHLLIRNDARYTIRKFIRSCISKYKMSEKVIYQNRELSSVIAMLPSITIT